MKIPEEENRWGEKGGGKVITKNPQKIREIFRKGKKNNERLCEARPIEWETHKMLMINICAHSYTTNTTDA